MSKNELATFNAAGFEVAQRMATALSKSDLIPNAFRNSISNCLVALELSQRTGASPLMVMQNLNIIHGKPSWSSTYIIAAINSCGRYEPLQFQFNKDKTECFAWAKLKGSEEKLEGPSVSIAMAKAEGWFDKAGSKWKTMPEVMLRYRSATFFGRLYAPEILMGMSSEEEVREIATVDGVVVESAVDKLNKKIKEAEVVKDA
jgi:hypothetical protein